MTSAALDPCFARATPALPLRVRLVLERVSALHRIPPEMMFEARRTARVMAARRHAWAELGRLIKPDGRPISSVQIGRWFGVDHTTVLYGVRQHRNGRYPFTRQAGAGQ
jgi:chromosomal replication initiation ATPase DnaA